MYPSTSRAESSYDGATVVEGPSSLHPSPVPKHSGEPKGKLMEAPIAEVNELPFVDNAPYFSKET